LQQLLLQQLLLQQLLLQQLAPRLLYTHHGTHTQRQARRLQSYLDEPTEPSGNWSLIEMIEVLINVLESGTRSVVELCTLNTEKGKGLD